MPTTTLRHATAEDRPVLERLWLMFRHDLSVFRGLLPNPDGTYRSGRLDAALAESDWVAYLLMSGDRPIGLALIRGLSCHVRVLSAFFVVRGARRRGLGMDAVRELTDRCPGRWEVAFQESNDVASRFWRRVATEIAGDTWTLERRAVPGRPELRPDTWISFEVT